MKIINNSNKKLFPIIMVFVLLICTVSTVLTSTSALEEPSVNYNVLNNFTEGTAPSSGEWTYGVRDFEEKLLFEVPSDDFASPIADWNAADGYATIVWDDVSEADEYELNISRNSVPVHSITLTDTKWQSSTLKPLYGGLTYEIQVLALKDGQQISASKIRSFKAIEKAKVNSFSINNFNAESQLSNVTFARFDKKSIINNQLVMKTKSDQTLARIYLKNAEGIKTSTAKAFAFYIKPDTEMLQTFRVAFGKSSATADLKYTASGETDTVYYISAANPNNTIESEISSTTTSKTESGYSEYCTGGYYVIIPLSLYDDDIRTNLTNGTYKFCDLLLQNIRYKDSLGEFPETAGKFDGTNITFDDVALIDDIDGYIKQLRQAYNRINDPETYYRILREELAGTEYTYTEHSNCGGEILVADVFNTENNTLTNTTADTGYKLYNTAQSRKVTFTAVSKSSFKYGSHLKFTAPNDGIYDLGGTLKVENNSTVTDSEVRYRVIYTDSNNNETIISGDGDWLYTNVTTDNLNPEMKFPVSQITLKAGESVAIEVYHVSAKDGEKLEISFGNPTATVVTGTSSYDGTTVEYKYSDYSDDRCFHTDGTGMGKHTPIDNRWNLFILEKSSDNIKYSRPNTIQSSWNLIYNNAVSQTGYYYSNSKVQIKKENTGLSFRFTAPTAGDAAISVPFKKMQSGKYVTDGVYARILKNGEKIYPSNSDWEALPTDRASFTESCDVAKGDVISLEFYGTSNAENFVFNKTPSVTVSDGKNANNLSDNIFSPLWERPYGNGVYVGECIIPITNVWGYNIMTVSNGDTTSADYYDYSNKMLYKNGNNDCGYIFNSESFEFAFGNGNKAMSLTFNVPTRGYYDFSSAFAVSSGTGTIKLRILRNEDVIWPAEGGYAEFTESIDFDALEIGALKGDKIIIEACAENSNKAVLNMAAPVMQRLSNRQYTENGNETVYNPMDYTAFEKYYNGKFAQLNSRFTYFFDGKSPIKTDSYNKKLILDNNYFAFNDDAIKISADTTAEISYHSLMSANGKISLTTLSNVEIQVLKNSEIISDWQSRNSYDAEIELDTDDIITFKFKGSNISIQSLTVAVTGYRNNTNSAEDNAFFAAYADPYPDVYYSEEYNGNYKKNSTEYWNFDFYDAENDQIKLADSYSATNNHKIYCKDFADAGYYFNDVLLTADINVKDGIGVSLGFTAPRADTFNSRYGLRLITADEEAVIKSRMIKISADNGKTNQIWPKEGWYEKTVKTNEDITIPYAEHSLKQGDVVYLQVYAISANSDKIAVNLVSPAIIQDKVTLIESEDIKAKVYNAYNYGPYNHIENYNGKYIPMDNRWNFRFSEVENAGNITNVFDANIIKTEGKEHSYYSSLYSVPQFTWDTDSKLITVRSYLASDKNIGTVIEYKCPYSGDISINSMPSLGTLAIEEATLKYRIVKKSVDDDATSVIWPLTGEWEVLDSENTKSDCSQLGAEVELGDVLEFQFYWDVPAEKLSEYLNGNNSTYWKPTFNVAPQVIAAYWLNTERTSYDPIKEFVPDYLINPYWRVQFAADENNLDWQYVSVFKETFWQTKDYYRIGISKNSLYEIYNSNNCFEDVNPVLAWLFTSRTEGTVKMSPTKVITVPATSTDGYTACFRITVNNEQVYPENGWTELAKGESTKLIDITFDVSPGDEIRFEVKSSKQIENGDKLRLTWNPAFSLSQEEKSIYSETDDIFNMLEINMYESFKKMEGKIEFDTDFENNRILSEQMNKWISGLNSFDYTDKEETSYSKPTTSNGVEDTYTEWTEEIITPGGGWKKIIRRTNTAWWVYLLIIAGAVAAVTGITITGIIIIKKKKAKKLQ